MVLIYSPTSMVQEAGNLTGYGRCRKLKVVISC